MNSVSFIYPFMIFVLGEVALPVAVFASPGIQNQSTSDILVLRAEIIGELSSGASSVVSMAACTTPAVGGYEDWLDCTRALSTKFGVPAFHSVYVKKKSKIVCRIVRVRVISKKIGFESSTGIGFSHGRKGRAQNVLVLSKNVLSNALRSREVLKRGMQGVIHEFVGLSNCILGSSSAMYRFRPFLQFSTPGGEMIRNWDRNGSYEVNPGSKGFDQRNLVADWSGRGATLGNVITRGKSLVVPSIGRGSQNGTSRGADFIGKSQRANQALEDQAFENQGSATQFPAVVFPKVQPRQSDSVPNQDNLRGSKSEQGSDLLFEEINESYLLPE